MKNNELIRWVNKNWDSLSPAERECLLSDLRRRAEGPKPDTGLQLCLGVHLADAGYLAESAAVFTSLTARKPALRVAWLGLAHAEEEAGNLNGALVAYQRAISLEETASTAVCAAVVADQLGQSVTAESLYRTALKLEPENDEAWSGLGITLGLQGKRDDARTAFAQALRFDPDSVVALRESALLTSNQDEKVARLEKATSLEPNDFWAWLYLGMAYYANDEFRKAEHALKNADDLDSSGEPLVWKYRALVCDALGDNREASVLAQRALNAGVDDPELEKIVSEEDQEDSDLH